MPSPKKFLITPRFLARFFLALSFVAAALLLFTCLWFCPCYHAYLFVAFVDHACPSVVALIACAKPSTTVLLLFKTLPSSLRLFVGYPGTLVFLWP